MIVICLLGVAIGGAVVFALRRVSGALRWTGAFAAGLLLPMAFAAFVVLKGDSPSPGARTISQKELSRWGGDAGDNPRVDGLEAAPRRRIGGRAGVGQVWRKTSMSGEGGEKR